MNTNENIIDVKLSWGYEYKNCHLVPGRYGNGNLALRVLAENDEPIMVASVNPGEEIPDDRIAIKDYSENQGIADTLVRYGYIEEEPEDLISSGFVEIPVYRLTEKGRALFS